EEVRRARDLRRQQGIQREDRGVAQIEELDPDDVAPTVVYLASEHARGVNGQFFLCFGNTVALVSQPRPVKALYKADGNWTLDDLVNNAGILRDRMLFNMTEEEWDAVIAVHLKGTFNCTRHAAVHMRQQRRGRIVSISSTSGVYGNSGQANYGAAKDGIAGLT